VCSTPSRHAGGERGAPESASDERTWIGDNYAGLSAILVVMIVAHRALRASPVFAPDLADTSAFVLAVALGLGLLGLLGPLVKFGHAGRK
jgi:hypothetical protein